MEYISGIQSSTNILFGIIVLLIVIIVLLLYTKQDKNHKKIVSTMGYNAGYLCNEKYSGLPFYYICRTIQDPADNTLEKADKPNILIKNIIVVDNEYIVLFPEQENLIIPPGKVYKSFSLKQKQGQHNIIHCAEKALNDTTNLSQEKSMLLAMIDDCNYNGNSIVVLRAVYTTKEFKEVYLYKIEDLLNFLNGNTESKFNIPDNDKDLLKISLEILTENPRQ